MNHHADKLDYSGEPEGVDLKLGGVLEEVHSCPECGKTALKVAR